MSFKMPASIKKLNLTNVCKNMYLAQKSFWGLIFIVCKTTNALMSHVDPP